MKPSTGIYILAIAASIVAPLFYCSNFSVFFLLQWGGLIAAAIIWLMQVMKNTGKVRLLWLSSILIFALIFLVTNQIFIRSSCESYISENESQLKSINDILQMSQSLSNANSSIANTSPEIPELSKEKLKQICGELNLEVSGNNEYVIVILKSGEIMGFSPTLFFNPGTGEIADFGLHEISGNWYYQ